MQHADSSQLCALLLAAGEGVTKSREEATRYYQLAATGERIQLASLSFHSTSRLRSLGFQILVVGVLYS